LTRGTSESAWASGLASSTAETARSRSEAASIETGGPAGIIEISRRVAATIAVVVGETVGTCCLRGKTGELAVRPLGNSWSEAFAAARA
jgi:hypothetical protein